MGKMRLAALIVPAIITVAFLTRLYGDSSYSICDDVASFGSARDSAELKGTVPPHHLNLQENVRCSLQYSQLTSVGFRKTNARQEGVAALAWKWGVSPHQPRRYWVKNLFGSNIYRLNRIPSLDRVMDNPHLEKVLIGIIVERKGRVSLRNMHRIFNQRAGTNFGLSTLHRKLVDMKALVKKQKYTPKLTPVHKLARYYYGGKHFNQRYRYWVDIDEKWFFVVRVRGFVWILPDHMDPDTCLRLPVQSKRYITKVMFLTAVARPIFNEDGSVLFDGKVGMWPVRDILRRKGNYTGKFTVYKKGDFYAKDVNMGAKKYVQMCTDLLLPAIKLVRDKYWLPYAAGAAFTIHVQHDGAPGHRAEGIERDLNEAFKAIGAIFDRQPPKSPDANMLDRCVFNSLEASVAEYHYSTKEELCAAVMQAWARLCPHKLERMWAGKCIVMWNFVRYLGELQPSKAEHNGLGKAHRKGWKQLWERVETQMARPAYHAK